MIGVQDADFGARLAAFVVRRRSRADRGGRASSSSSNLARYKVPRDILFLAELPRNPSGKVLKRRLGELHGDLARGEPTESEPPRADQ